VLLSEIVVGKGEYQISVTKHLIWDAVNWKKFVRRDNTAILIIDPQNDCATEGGALDKIGWKAWRYIRESGSVDNIISIVEASRKLKLPVIWTRFLRKKGFTDARPGSLEEAMLKFYASAVPGLWEEGTWDVELIDEVLEVKRPEDLVLDKPASSAFIGTVLERFLRNWKIEVLIIGGYYTGMCVESTARDAFDLGYMPIIVGDACMDHGPDKETALQVHKSCLDRLDGRLGMVNMQSTSTVLELLNEMV